MLHDGIESIDLSYNDFTELDREQLGDLLHTLRHIPKVVLVGCNIEDIEIYKNIGDEYKI